MKTNLAWDDLRIILAVAEAGSLAGAGRKLALSHATVFRRLGDIERRLGVKLFNRARTGYTPTAAGEEAAEAARRIEGEVQGIERRIAGRDLRPSGTVRVTTTDALLVGLLSPIFAAFRDAYPDISLEVAVSNQLFSLTKREADIAIRPSSAPPEALVGRKLATIAQAVYGRRDRIDLATGGPRLETLDWIGADERMAYRDLDAWMARNGLDGQCRYRVDSVLGMAAAARAGLGVAVLPCYLGDGDDRLTAITPPVDELATDLWLLTHPDLRRTARIRAVLDFVADAAKAVEARPGPRE